MAGNGKAGLSPRDHVIEEYTRTVCPSCFAAGPRRSDEAGVFKDGMLVRRDGRIWLRRFCAEHGETESLYEEDAEIWEARRGWGTPTLQVVPDRPGNFAGFPDGYRQGLPASHGQHTCILLLNLTERCNYGCATCYASALSPGEPPPAEERPTPREIAATVQTMLAREGGRLGVVMLSGGEPTLRRDLPEIVDLLAPLPITRIMLNTNGRRLARDDRFLERLVPHRDRLEVYLQLDSLRPEATRALRQEDAVEEKLRALERLDRAQIFTTLVMSVQRGINEGEVGEVLRRGLDLPHCSGMAVQPVFASGRGLPLDPGDRVTPTGVLRRLEEQTGGLLTWRDFVPLPCSHRDCCDLTYLLRGADGAWRSLPSLVGRDELRRWLHLVANTITFDSLKEPAAELLRSGALQRVLSEQLKVGTLDLTRDLLQVCGCVPGLSQFLGSLWSGVAGDRNALQQVARRTFRITVKMFMDAHTLHEARIRQCCVHTGTYEDDPRRYSFCWRWLFTDATDFPRAAEAAVVELPA